MSALHPFLKDLFRYFFKCKHVEDLRKKKFLLLARAKKNSNQNAIKYIINFWGTELETPEAS